MPKYIRCVWLLGEFSESQKHVFQFVILYLKYKGPQKHVNPKPRKLFPGDKQSYKCVPTCIVSSLCTVDALHCLIVRQILNHTVDEINISNTYDYCMWASNCFVAGATWKTLAWLSLRKWWDHLRIVRNAIWHSKSFAAKNTWCQNISIIHLGYVFVYLITVSAFAYQYYLVIDFTIVYFILAVFSFLSSTPAK